MDWLQIMVLALVQGITEFLPVSSSAHLILVPVFTSWQDQGLAFDVALHLGSLCAILVYFRHDILAMFTGWVRSLQTRTLDADGRLAWAVLLGTIPVGLAGLALGDLVETVMRSPLYMAAGMIIFGLLLGWADWRFKGMRTERELNWKDVLLIGMAQAVALFPGTSRSGITLTAGLILGLSRQAAARFSFLLSIPVILIASARQGLALVSADVQPEWGAIAAGTALAALSAYACIHFFLAFIQRIGMMPFVIYRLVLGVLLIVLFV